MSELISGVEVTGYLLEQFKADKRIELTDGRFAQAFRSVVSTGTPTKEELMHVASLSRWEDVATFVVATTFRGPSLCTGWLGGLWSIFKDPDWKMPGNDERKIGVRPAFTAGMAVGILRATSRQVAMTSLRTEMESELWQIPYRLRFVCFVLGHPQAFDHNTTSAVANALGEELVNLYQQQTDTPEFAKLMDTTTRQYHAACVANKEDLTHCPTLTRAFFNRIEHTQVTKGKDPVSGIRSKCGLPPL